MKRWTGPVIAVAVGAALAIGCGPKGPELVRRPAPPPPAVLIRNVAVLDVVAGTLVRGRDVLIVGDQIERIVPTSSAAPPGGAAVIDGSPGTLLPGFIDMHGHVGNNSAPPWVSTLPDVEANVRSYLYCGVTTVLDPAGLSSQAFALRDRVAHGELLGPRQYAAGPVVTAPGGHPVTIIDRLAPWWIRWYLRPRIVREVDSPEAARAAVDEIAGLGADVVKVIVDRVPDEAPRIRREVLAAAVAEAKARKLRAVAHIGTTEDAVDAAEAGVAAWVHGVYQERIPDDQVARLVAYHIPMVATMVVFDSYGSFRDKRIPTALEAETVPGEVLHAFDALPEGDATMQFFRPSLDKMARLRPVLRENVRRLHEAGVVILAGSDAQLGVFPGPELHREFRLLAEAGLSNLDVIRATTLLPARFLEGRDDPTVGIVAPGKRADLVLVAGDPLTDLGALSRIQQVLAGGVPLVREPVGVRR